MRLKLRPSVRACVGFCAAALVSASALADSLPSPSPESVGMSSERLARLDAATHDWVDVRSDARELG